MPLRLPPRRASATARFPLPPKPSVAAFHGGQGFSVTPDRADLDVDVRTPAFDAHDAETFARKAVVEPDAELPAPAPAKVVRGATRPPFRPAEDEQPTTALREG
ncbi:hypothetical protein ACF07T_15110 [Streptomyces sp. NPDC015184]|uniref:hypothetical protein n=1 Tax=Streptomyces sp. NPDC015184 TaxID=3364946 RepID=UPI0036F76AB9